MSWQKLSCNRNTRVSVQNILHTQNLEPADGLWIAAPAINWKLLDSDRLEWGEGVFSGLSGCLGRRTIKYPAAGLATHHLRHWVFSTDARRDTGEKSEVCIGLRDGGGEAVLLWAGKDRVGSDGYSSAQEGISVSQWVVMAQAGKQYSCNMGSWLWACLSAPKKH